MEELLWSMIQQSRTLQDLRRDISHVWDDEAAREINSRYLDPHDGDDNRMVAAINEQMNLLAQGDQQLEQAQEYARQVEECMAIVTEKVELAGQDLSRANDNYDDYANYAWEARAKLPLVRQLISTANAACE